MDATVCGTVPASQKRHSRSLAVNSYRAVLFLIHLFQLNHADSFKRTHVLSLRIAVTLRT